MRILLAIDDSTFAEAAAQAVLAQCEHQDTEVQVLHVLEAPSLLVAREMGGYDRTLESIWEAQQKLGETLVNKIAERLRANGLKVVTTVQEGDPKSTIIEAAAKWPADLVVVGSHGRKGLSRFLLGSVSDAVVRHAPCSVELVRIRSAPSQGAFNRNE